MKTITIKIALVILFGCFANMALMSQVSKVIELTTAGTLIDYDFGETSFKEITDLTISGNIDARDVRFMRDSMLVLANINMEDAVIKRYVGTEGPKIGSYTTYPANQFPEKSFYFYGTTSAGKKSITSIVFPSSITSVGEDAFIFCDKLETAVLPDGVKNIYDFAFGGCQELVSLNIPKSLVYIGFSAFQDCRNLETLEFPETLTFIGESAFAWCYNLKKIVFPKNLATIETDAFKWCSLEEIRNYNPEPISIAADVFKGVNKSNCNLIVLEESVGKYNDALVWKEFNVLANVDVQDSDIENIILYPNPAKDYLYIDLQGFEESSVLLQIYDSNGSLYLDKTFKGGAKHDIFIGNFSAGTYFVKINDIVTKFVKISE